MATTSSRCNGTTSGYRSLLCHLVLAATAVLTVGSPQACQGQWVTSGSRTQTASGIDRVVIGPVTPNGETLQVGPTSSIHSTPYDLAIRFNMRWDNNIHRWWYEGNGYASQVYLSGDGISLLTSNTPGSANSVVSDLAEALRLTVIGRIGIGIHDPRYTLQVSGAVGAREIVVRPAGWPDYVFREDYRLRPLTEVESYIQANGHLPDIPSAEEVRQSGVGMGEMQAKLLRKIEELTLHLIEQEEENRKCREGVIQLENQIIGNSDADSRRKVPGIRARVEERRFHQKDPK